MHWAIRKKLADKYHEQIKNAVINIPRTDWAYPVSISFCFNFTSRPLDASNCFYMAKMLEDGLKESEIIIDDSPKYVEEIRIKSRKSDEEMVEICVECSQA